MNRYNRLNEYLKDKFGERVLKICVDGGFTCPNRDGKLSKSGCIFCNSKGSRASLSNLNDISSQVKNYLSSYKAERANKFIVYFQNFTNTYDTVDNLKKKYDSALIDDKIVGLAIATRPDCINENIAKVIKSYSDKYYVFVELGLQTSNDETGRIINRCYLSEEFTSAVKVLNKYKIDTVAHIIIGLPNETFDDIKNTVNFLNKHDIQGIKIHSCYALKNTKLGKMYEKGEYTPIELNEYITQAVYVLTHISPNIIIHRLSGDADTSELLAPSWNLHKKWILNGINKKMVQENLYQGMYFDH